MAVFRRLLLSCGGGVIDSSHLEYQRKSVAIALGLGGLGIRCLRNLKKQVYSRLQPDDPNDAIPKYSHIRFLAVDSDNGSLGADDAYISLDEKTEYFPLFPSLPYRLPNIDQLAGKPEYSWWYLANEEIRRKYGQLDLSSMRGVRQLTRLLLMDRSDQFCSLIEKLISEAAFGLPADSEINIHIFTGLAGQTGSSIFLDVCYLIQEALRRLEVKSNAEICGYVFMPDVILHDIPSNSVISSYIKSSAYAAMKELDYCMDFANNNGCWDQEYRGFHVGPTQDSPVDVCHLLSAHNVSGENMRDGPRLAMNVVSEFIMQFLVESRVVGGGYSLRLYSSSCKAAIRAVNAVTSSSHNYCLLGAAVAAAPMKEGLTYLSSSLFEKTSQKPLRYPTKDEVSTFAKDIGLTCDQLMDALMNGTSFKMPVLEMDYKKFLELEGRGDQDTLFIPEAISKPYQEGFLVDFKGQVTSNLEAIMNPCTSDGKYPRWKAYRAYQLLSSLATDAEYGPDYAAKLLGGDHSINLINCLYGMEKEASWNLHNAKLDIKLAISQIKYTRDRYMRTFLKRKLFDEFLSDVAKFYFHVGYIYTLEQMDILQKNLIQQYTELYEECFLKFQQVNSNLVQSFQANRNMFAVVDGKTDIYWANIILPENFLVWKQFLDSIVSKLDISKEKSRFLHFLFYKPEVWCDDNEYIIYKEVSDYLAGLFHQFTNMSWMDHLKTKIGAYNRPVSLNDVCRDILLSLMGRAEPFFWKRSMQDVSCANPFEWVCLPDLDPTILSEVNCLRQRNINLNSFTNVLFRDRVTVIRGLRGVSMSAYHLLDDCRKSYREDHSVGMHLYEGTANDPRDWRSLPDL